MIPLCSRGAAAEKGFAPPPGLFSLLQGKFSILLHFYQVFPATLYSSKWTWGFIERLVWHIYDFLDKMAADHTYKFVFFEGLQGRDWATVAEIRGGERKCKFIGCKSLCFPSALVKFT